MKSASFVYPIADPVWIEKLCRWADVHFDFFAYTNGNDHQYPEAPFTTRFFAGNNQLTEKEIWSESCGFKKVGIIGYDFKNQLEKLQSDNSAFFDLPDICFFKSSFSLAFDGGNVHSDIELSQEFWKEVENTKLPTSVNTSCIVTPQISRERYLETVHTIQNHIIEGNTYESNFCQAYSGTFDYWDPITAYFNLNKLSPMPFSSLFKAKSQWLVSASPERYLKRTGSKIIAQPIKGTIKRGKSIAEDVINRETLAKSEKEQAENLMITDLMRNDLSKVSKTGTVKVKELFGIYPLPRVFQMISTVISDLKEDVSFSDIIQASFPMGSMTGAPKIRTMEIIDELESFKRGWFSGAFGVIEENGDFDFSVIIRSIIADLEVKKLYFGVGSAITFDADAAQEYEECGLKAQAILEVLSEK
ncbi:anthranilate synthase component I family protein [Algoriphagus sp. D3-2-R+10]|uniref:anthranilate synthase component I family protein n=1 Tax=Algoriphagus aurantiacus TaxID=3103948 RepID=UPI002B3B6296|nr:anthranilate synthase component I family protein [Algoriphagus sp. D3-2-R+10]MEB2777587.1 anthranilate synthase component I family protein [Algoriphagus sp. D3-2-R+10]